MFGSNDKSKGNRNQGNVETLIGPRVVIRGDLHFSGGIRIDGCIKGNVIARGAEGQTRALLVLSDKGRIEGGVYT